MGIARHTRASSLTLAVPRPLFGSSRHSSISSSRSPVLISTITMKVLFYTVLSSALFSLALARMAYEFSSGYENIIGEPSRSFTCEGRQYGYYADVANDCQVFHVCLPIEDDLGEIVRTDQYSFFCGNQTVFNQESLTCDHPGDAFPCDQAASLYDLVNSEFGRIPDDDQ